MLEDSPWSSGMEETHTHSPLIATELMCYDAAEGLRVCLS